MQIKGYQVGPLMKKVGSEIMDDDVLDLAAQTAYYFFFSLFPIFLFLAPLLALIGDKRETFNFLLNQLGRAVPGDAFKLVQSVVADVVFAPSAPGVVSVGALLALWSGSNVFSGLMASLNTVYDLPQDTRPYWKRKLIALACLLGIGGLFILAAVVLVFGPNVVDWVGDHVGLGGTARTLWNLAQIPIAGVLVTAVAFITFKVLPDAKQRNAHVLVAAVVTTVLWLIVTLGFRLYVQKFGDYNKTYGTIGGVIVLLTWMYLSSLVLLAGGELAAELMHGTGATKSRAGHLYGDRISTGGPTDQPSVDAGKRATA